MFCTQCGQENPPNAQFCSACGARMGAAPQAPAAATSVTGESSGLGTVPDEVRYAGFWYRALALLIDWVLVTILALVIVMPLAFIMGASMAGSSDMHTIEAAGQGLGNLLGIIISWLYYTIFESSEWQATPGKRMLGLRVTDLDGQRIGFGRANARYWSKILSALILMIGYLMAAFTRRKQALHDLIASTLVLKR
ncbi:RDD family protein [Thioalkalivibrio sp. ALJ7]|uniref:RDD family protein n=1 Tax=Thioalkalivibrio sp. ALJ7 TaxID=1158756 RepID=UPI000475C12E|nr:RDD family protein [Thioalkalivibrio sp. ALJ7]